MTVSACSGMAWEKTAHRPPSRLALSPPSKIKAPCRFSLSPSKYPSFFEIPYQSPKKCLKTQITTFSILKFSPKAKNTPVLTVFTLFLLSSYYYSHHPVFCSIALLLPSSSHCHHYHPAAFAFLKIPRGKTYQPIIVYLPLFAIIIVYPPLPISILKFHEVLSDSEIPGKYHTQSPTKTICSEVFFWVCLGFLSFSFAITVLSCFVPHSRSIISLYDFTYLARFFVFYDFVYFHLIFFLSFL